MATLQLDVPRLAAYVSLPEPHLASLLQAPTINLVQSLLSQISAKAVEHEQERAKGLRLEVELENSVRGRDAKDRLLRGSLEKAQKDAVELRRNLQAEGQ